MNHFRRLWHAEVYKIFCQKKSYVFMGIMFLMIFVNGLILNEMSITSSNWEQQVQDEISATEKTIKNPDIPSSVVNSLHGNIDRLEYHLENNINPYETNVWTFIQASFLLMSFITLFSVIFASKTVSSEHTKGTMKFLMVRPFKRWEILLAKYFSVITYSFLLLLTFVLSSVIVGSLLFGLSPFDFTVIKEVNGGYQESLLALESLTYIILKFLSTLVIVTVAFTISTVCKSETLAVIISLGILFGGTIFSSFTQSYKWSEYLLFNNLNLTNFIIVDANISSQIFVPLIVIAVHLILMLFLSFLFFSKRDITTV